MRTDGTMWHTTLAGSAKHALAVRRLERRTRDKDERNRLSAAAADGVTVAPRGTRTVCAAGGRGPYYFSESLVPAWVQSYNA